MTTELRARLDAATATKPLLQHPFYKAWAAGTLTRDDLSFYAGQYWRQVEAFPTYLETVASRLPQGVARETVLSNLADERGDDHPGLWLDFAEGLGSDRTTTANTGPEAETETCVEAFATAAQTATPAFAMGMLYGYESQTPGVAATKIEGLRDFYGVQGPATTYFHLHGELDVQHSGDMAKAIGSVATDEQSQEEAVAGARAGAEAIWKLLDGVARARGIC